MIVLLLAVAVALALVLGADGAATASPADCATNEIACENEQPGNPRTEWDIQGAGDPSIQGFAAPFSINHGARVEFRVNTDAAAYRIDIYRLGWYAGLGARKVATLLPEAPLPQQQPDCIRDETTGLVDCGNWAVSASWDVPADAVSGVYVGKLVRPDTGGESQIYFVVRDDEGHSDLLVQTSDTTWQAYNRYGGNSLYVGSPGRASKVSYNRPFTTRGHTNTSFLFNGEYPMIRWLERNGYDVSYASGIDTASRAPELLEHDAFLSVGHDEYWSAQQRANVEAARAAGVNLAFFSGNESFWKTRWEPSIDGKGTPYTTLVSYKETAANAKIDPNPAWTGTWRDARFSPPSDGGRPENGLTGTLFTVNSYREDALKVPAEFAGMRFWRNTSVASLTTGQTATFPLGILGHEWDEDVDNGFRPTGLFNLSATTITVPAHLVDQGNTYTTGAARHALTLYRAASGALVFGAGTVQWAWGLDDVHDIFSANPPRAPDGRMQQATVNLFADMHAQPASLQSGLVPATASADVLAPKSTITTPSTGTVVRSGTVVTIAGTATESGGGQIAAVEVTTDGGETWHRATGRTSWIYPWTAGGDSNAIVQTRAIDDSGNIEVPKPGIVIEVACPCHLWPSSATPGTTASADTQSVELGVKFRADVDGWMTGLRFYKGSGNAGSHVGSLWTAGGALLSRALFTGETSTGWQEVQLDAPVQVTAGTTYVASYNAPVGRYSLDRFYFQSSTYTNIPLRAPSTGSSGGNGVYAYGTEPVFPTQSHEASNYWVDVVFYDREPLDTRRPKVVEMLPASNAQNGDAHGTIDATLSEAIDPATVTSSSFELRTTAGALVPATVAYDQATRRAILRPTGGLAYETTYSATVKTGTTGVKDTSGNMLDRDTTWSFRTAALPPCPCTLWAAGTAPLIPAASDGAAVEVGVKFQADLPGWISGIRFYKGSGNGGTHVGSLWTSDGQLLARATFISESSTGWQQLLFDGPIPIAAGTTYVASYHAPNGRYSLNMGGFAASGFGNPPLRALRSEAESGNGVYHYGSAPTFPNSTYGSSNYWVDVVYTVTPPADTQPPRVTAYSPAAGTTVAIDQALEASFSERLDPATVTPQTFTLRRADGAAVAAAVTYDSGGTARLTPAGGLELGQTYLATLRGGPTGITDAAGNALLADVSWSFSTVGCPCTIWDATAQPAVASSADAGSVEVGVKFRSSRAGWISGIRFYRGAGNAGTHVGSLWAADGTLLGRATFEDETSTGWQEATFGGPVAITADTTYVASYFAPSGGYARTSGAFGAAGVVRTPLSALRDGDQGGNGVFRYGAAPAFPNDSFGATNYWVDVVYTPTRPPDSSAPGVSSFSPASAATGVSVNDQVLVGFDEAMDPASITSATVLLRDGAGQNVAGSVSYDASFQRATVTPAAPLRYSVAYTVLVRGGASGVKDASGNGLPADVTSSFSTRTCPCGLWSDEAVPTVASSSDNGAVELGVRFQTEVAGTITGIRFYKGAGNDGTHVGSLWRPDGTLLARATFTAESAGGWQQAFFTEPVAIAAGTEYIASYHAPRGRYSVDLSYFGGAGHAYAPLSAPAGVNGVYAYGAEPSFPTETWASSNYWVDVSFDPAP